MDLKKIIGNTTSVPSIDFNQVVKCDNLRYFILPLKKMVYKVF